MKPTRTDVAWLLLLAATAITFGFADHGAAGPGAMAVVLALTFAKGRLVALEFLGLRTASLGWRLVVIGWLAGVLALVATAYLLALPG